MSEEAKLVPEDHHFYIIEWDEGVEVRRMIAEFREIPMADGFVKGLWASPMIDSHTAQFIEQGGLRIVREVRTDP